jgi:hypothetical protein
LLQQFIHLILQHVRLGRFFVAMAITVNGKLNFNIYKTLDISFSGMARF